MSCNNYDACVNKEKEHMRYPIDSESLYFDRVHDNQTANTRCYRNHPIEFVEAFGYKISWERVLKLIVVILLIVLFVTLAKEFVFHKKELPKIDMSPASSLKMTPYGH